MNRLTKIELGAAGVCLIALSSTVIASNFNNNDLNVSIVGNTNTSYIDSHNSTEADNINRNLIPTYDKDEGIEMLVSFKAVPDPDLSTDNMLVFVSDEPNMTINVPIDKEYPLTEEIMVVGTLYKTDEYMITLSNCEIIINTPEKQNVTSDIIPAQTTQTQQTATQSTTNRSEIQIPTEATVYVSASGKYHSKSNCSGMKNYTEMTLTQAKDNGYDPCKKCYPS